MFTRPIRHRTIVHRQGVVMRAAMPPMMCPPARPMREPRTNYLTYITAEGPRTVRL